MNSRSWLLLILSLLLLLAFVGGSVINYLITRSAVHREIVKNDLPLTMDNIYSEISAELTRPILVASSMASDTFLKDWVMDGELDPEKVRKYLAEIQQKYGFFSTFFISSYTFNYYHFKGIHKQIRPDDSHDVWYYRFIGSGKEYDLDVDTDEAADNVLTVFINHRVVDEQGRLLGVTGVGLKMAGLARLVQTYEEKYGRHVYLADQGGSIQIHQDSSLIETNNIADLTGLGKIAQELLGNTETPGNYEFEREGDRIFLNSRYMDSLNWFLFVEQSETTALATARMNFFRSVIIGAFASILIILITLTTISRYQRKVELLAVTDELTGIANRRKLEKEFDLFSYRFVRKNVPFSLILLDLDGFKRINDELGHLQGDEVLQIIAREISDVLRPTDVFARWGGDEFAILVETTGVRAVQIAERIRGLISEIEWPSLSFEKEDPRTNISASVGVAPFGEGDTFDTLLLKADQQMYIGKQAGGNRVELS